MTEKLNLDKFIDKAKESLLTGIQLYIEINGSTEFSDKPSLTDNEELIKGVSLNVPIKEDVGTHTLLSISIVKDKDGEIFLLGKILLTSAKCVIYSYLENETLNILNQIIEALYENQNRPS